MVSGSIGAIALLAAVAAPVSNAASDAALAWLSTVDQGHYAESWSQAGEAFRSRVGQAAWVAQIGPIREPLGAVLSRRTIREQATTSLPGAPDGRYDIVQFATDFAHKRSAVETVVLAEEASHWRVVGYYVK